MTTKKSTKSKNDDQEPLTNFQKADEDQLEDPALFEEMNVDRIPKLEKKGRAYLAQKDMVKRETAKRDELDEECQLIMADHQIEKYYVKGLKLRIKRGKAHVEGETD